MQDQIFLRIATILSIQTNITEQASKLVLRALLRSILRGNAEILKRQPREVEFVRGGLSVTSRS